MKQQIKIGTLDYTAIILIRDTAGAPKTGLTFESAGLDVSYARIETDNDVVVTAGAPVTTTLTGVHVDWGFVEVDATNHPGLYKLDIADGVFAEGAWSAVVTVIGTGLDPTHIEYMLLDYDLTEIGGSVDDIITNQTLMVGGGFDTDTDSLKILSDRLDDILEDTGTTLDTDLTAITALLNIIKASVI